MKTTKKLLTKEFPNAENVAQEIMETLSDVLKDANGWSKADKEMVMRMMAVDLNRMAEWVVLDISNKLNKVANEIANKKGGKR